MAKKHYILISYFLIAILCNAQEGLRPTTTNLNYFYKDLNKSTKINNGMQSAKALNSSINLPFIEDFFYAQYKAYPDTNLWQSKDSSVYINTTYPLAPPSIGVATFDGLNKYGYPYKFNLLNLNLSFPADTLTSKQINLYTVGAQTLQVSDSVALSFFYQARGNGDSPEITDSLLVDFKNPLTNKWTNVWYSRGNTNSNTNDTIFKRAFIWVDSAYYLQDGFQFRFRNKATVAGNFDHWHVDYIKLDRFRSRLGDTTYNDLTFGGIPTPLIKNYAEMPWQQFTQFDMDTIQSVRIRNNDDVTINMKYKNSVVAGVVAPAGNYDGGTTNCGSFKSLGWEKYAPHVRPPITYTILPLTDSAEIKVQHIVQRTGSSTVSDFSVGNDTVMQHQFFKNYYAYDDGSCETGYYVLGQGGKMALKFTLNYLDTLRSLRIYFDPAGYSTSDTTFSFRINIWANGGNGPGVLLYRDSVMHPKYYNKIAYNTYPDYALKTRQILNPGTYYIGIQQQVANGITIGFDKNLDHHQSLFFDSGNGWTQSSIYGSLMLRPVFGKKIVYVGVNQNKVQTANDFEAFPNPAGELMYLKMEKLPENCTAKILNTFGQTVWSSSLIHQKTTINISQLQAGIYFVILQSNNQTLQTKKIIIQH